MSTRRRPLYTCGASILAMVNRAYRRVQDPAILSVASILITLLKRLTNTASFFVCALQYRCLAILSAADSCILIAEKVIEKIFPPSGYVFDKVDELVGISESFPERYDQVIDKVCTAIRRFPIPDCGVARVISWLEFFVSALAHSESKRASDKEIQVDTGCPDRFGCAGHSEDAEEAGPTSGNRPVEAGSPTKYTYKEALQKGTKEEEQVDKEVVGRIGEDHKRDVQGREDRESGTKEGDDHHHSNGGTSSDPILELFETAWLKKPKREKENSTEKSGSYS